MARCENCGHENPGSNLFCTSCGTSLATENISSHSVSTAPEETLKNPTSTLNSNLNMVLEELRNVLFSIDALRSSDSEILDDSKSNLENRKSELLITLNRILESESKFKTPTRIEYFSNFLQEVLESDNSLESESELLDIIRSNDLEVTSDNESKRITVSPPSNPAGIDPSVVEQPIPPFFGWSRLWTTLFSENAMSTFLGLGILLMTVSSLVLLVNWWSDQNLRPYLIVLASVQMLAFIIIGHIVKWKIGLHLSGLAFITIGAVWSIFAAGMLAYLTFDPLTEYPRIPGIDLQVNLQPLAWLMVSGIATPVWLLLAYRYQGHILTQGAAILFTTSSVLVIASFGHRWELWEWAVTTLPLIALMILFLRKYIYRANQSNAMDQLLWTALAIGIASPFILTVNYLGNSVDHPGPIAFSFFFTAISCVLGFRFSGVRWLEHVTALFLPVSAYLFFYNWIDDTAPYIKIILSSIGFIYLYVGLKPRFSELNKLERQWPILRPWFLVSLLTIIFVSIPYGVPTWTSVTSMIMGAVIAFWMASKWQGTLWRWVPILPLIAGSLYFLSSIPKYLSISFMDCGFCDTHPFPPLVAALLSAAGLLCLRLIKGKFNTTTAVTSWSILLIFTSLILSIPQDQEGEISGIVNRSYVATLPIIILSLLSVSKLLRHAYSKPKLVSLNLFLRLPRKLTFNKMVPERSISLPEFDIISKFAAMLLIPIWIISVLQFVFEIQSWLPFFVPVIWWISSTGFGLAVIRGKNRMWLYLCSVAMHIAVYTTLTYSAFKISTNVAGLGLSAFTLFYALFIYLCFHNELKINNRNYRSLLPLYVPVGMTVVFDSLLSIVLSGWKTWDTWEGLTVCAVYTILSVLVATISKSRFIPYLTMALIFLVNIFAIGIVGGTWGTRAVGWATQGFVFWWLAIGIGKFFDLRTKTYLTIWINPLNNSAHRTALFAAGFTFLSFLFEFQGSGENLLAPTSVISILGLLYLGKAINERNLTNGYIAAISLLISWYVQVLGRDLSGIQYYTIPAGIYLLTLAFFEVRRGNSKPNLSTTANILGVLILGCSSFLQSSLDSQGNVLFFVLLTGIEGVLLTLWGLFAKFKTVFIGGILTFTLNILYQVAFLLSGLNGALLALGVGILIILTVVVIERTKTRLIAKSKEWTDALENWHW